MTSLRGDIFGICHVFYDLRIGREETEEKYI